MIKSKLKHILFDMGITIKQVSDETGLDRFFLSRLANNKVKDLKLESFNILCTYLNKQPGELLIRDIDSDESINLIKPEKKTA